MKKLLPFLIGCVLLFTSCTLPIERVKDSKTATTVTLMETEKDTVPIIMTENRIYVFDKEGHVEYKVDSYDPIKTGAIAVALFLGMFLVIVILD